MKHKTPLYQANWLKGPFKPRNAILNACDYLLNIWENRVEEILFILQRFDNFIEKVYIKYLIHKYFTVVWLENNFLWCVAGITLIIVMCV
jgi:hypothetical protein